MTVDLVNILEWFGCGFGALGALVLALNTSQSRWGFALFLLSNIAWIAFGAVTKTHGLVVMQLVMTGTSLLGLYRWRRPRRPSLHAAEVVPLPHRIPHSRKTTS